MSASGAVQPGPPEAAVGPSPPAAAGSPATGPLFRPLSAEDEEQQPTEIESLCMNCYRNVSLRPGTTQPCTQRPFWHTGRRQVEVILPNAASASLGHDAASAHQDPLL